MSSSCASLHAQLGSGVGPTRRLSGTEVLRHEEGPVPVGPESKQGREDLGGLKT